MVAYKASQLTAFLEAPDGRIGAALLYGPEPAQVADHANTLARRVAGGDDAEIVRIDERDLAEDPGRLATEAQTLSMFSARKVIRVTAGARFPVNAVEEMLAGPLEAWLIVEAGNLRPTAKLRKVFETSPVAAALPCYELGGRDMGQFIDAAFSGYDVTVGAQARAHLVTLFGGNQARARAEIEKLALYVGTGGSVTLADIEMALGDVSQAALDTLCAEAGNRNAGEALRQLDRLIAAGQGPQGAILALGRHFERLHRLCAALEKGEPASAALGRFRPPLHFRQKDILQAQARNWPRARAARAVHLIARAAQAARRWPELENSLTERLLLTLAR